MSCIKEVLYLLTSVLWSKERTLTKGVSHSQGGTVPGIELLDEVPWPHGFSNHDALFEIWNLAPVSYLVDDAIDIFFKLWIAFATNRWISCNWNKNE